MVKCDICKQKIEELYLKKIKGTYVKDEKGKRHPVCFVCQEKHENDKTKMLEAISNS